MRMWRYTSAIIDNLYRVGPPGHLTRKLLDACILDLLDNCLDGANSVIANRSAQIEPRYEGFWAEIELPYEYVFSCLGVVQK